MKKKYIIFGFILVVFISLLGASAFRLKQKHDFRQTITDIPVFCLPQVVDSIPFCNAQLAEDKPVVLMYFHPECDICQIEAQQIQQKQDIINTIQWIFISYAERDSLNKFATTFHLNNIPKLTILMDSQLELYNRLQIKSIPSCYIYNRRHQLVKVIKGIERIENIIQLANQ